MRPVYAGAVALMLVSCSSGGGGDDNVAFAESQEIADLRARVVELEKTLDQANGDIVFLDNRTARLDGDLATVRGSVQVLSGRTGALEQEQRAPGAFFLAVWAYGDGQGDRQEIYAVNPETGALVTVWRSVPLDPADRPVDGTAVMVFDKQTRGSYGVIGVSFDEFRIRKISTTSGEVFLGGIAEWPNQAALIFQSAGWGTIAEGGGGSVVLPGEPLMSARRP